MSRIQKGVIIILRIIVGWFFLYAGISAIIDPSWSIEPFIQGAHTFSHFYQSISTPTILPYFTYLIKGIFVLSGGLLILGIFVRIGALFGMALMLFFYFPLLAFPYVTGGYYLVDYHIIAVIALLFLFTIRAGEFFGLGTMFKFSRY
jgi:thiosulfate dehydrogenase [quinone] large subunit